MTKKQVRLGSNNNDKARLSPVTIRHLDELCQQTGNTKSEIIGAAILMYYMEVVHEETKRQLEELQKAYDALYAHHCDVINQ